MRPDERQLVLDQLTSSESRQLALLDGLTLAQWSFREGPERWSIAENIEHLAVFEDFILRAIATALAGTPAEPGNPALAAAVAAKDTLVLSVADARNATFTAREATRPTGRWPDTADLVHLRAARARTLAFATETDANLRSRFFAHIAFGDLNCYQWLLLLGHHTLRHTRQIEQVMAHAAYPAGPNRPNV
jgi:DinB superfamily